MCENPSLGLKIYLYGYLNRVQSSRRLEQEARRNLELMWLVGRLAPDFKTLADFRSENVAAIKNVCREFIVLCRRWNLFTEATVAIDGSKFKAVNHRDRNFTSGKMATRITLIEQRKRCNCGEVLSSTRSGPSNPGWAPPTSCVDDYLG